MLLYLDLMKETGDPHCVIMPSQLMRMSEDAPLQRAPLWERQDLSPTALVREFLRECRIVRKGLDGSLIKVTS